jgi:hypothetical protein
MVQVCFCAVQPPIFSFTSYPFFYPRNSIFGDSSVQYNILVARTSIRRRNGHLPAHGRLCGHSMRCVSSAPFLSHIHSHFIYLFSPILVLDIYSVYATANCTHRAPLVAIQTRNRSRVALHIPMCSIMAFVVGSGKPGSSCRIDMLCTWAACAPTGAQSISFCLLHFYGPHWP